MEPCIRESMTSRIQRTFRRVRSVRGISSPIEVAPESVEVCDNGDLDCEPIPESLEVCDNGDLDCEPAAVGDFERRPCEPEGQREHTEQA